jgi:hypothetical protein
MMGGTSYHELANRNPRPTIRPTATRSAPIVPDCLMTSSSRACASGRRTYGSPDISGARFVWGGHDRARCELTCKLLEIADRFIVNGPRPSTTASADVGTKCSEDDNQGVGGGDILGVARATDEGPGSRLSIVKLTSPTSVCVFARAAALPLHSAPGC